MHAEHADEPAWFIGMGHAFDLQAWLAKIKQQESCGPAAFRLVHCIRCASSSALTVCNSTEERRRSSANALS